MRFHIVSHTHWDREWHKTFEEYRVKLITVIDDLLELLEKNKDYRSFMLDGQTVVLEDYLEIRPENRQRLARLIKEKRIIIGPWYIQPDEFIPSGEALIRNLLIGIQIGEEFGPVMEIGYLPDSFGQSVHIPQILKGFGINDAVVWRGISDEDVEKKEFWWAGPDGQKVLNHYLPLGYENAKFLSLDEENNKNVIETNILHQKSLTDCGEILMLCGYDQREPNKDLPEIIDSLNKQYEKEGHQFQFSTLEEYIYQVRESKKEFSTIVGEFRKGKHMRVHASIGSTRLDIKKMNFENQSLYEKYTEPISALAFLKGYSYDNAMINHGWKYIIQNHAHDSMCNVCTDITHDEMKMRYKKAEQIGRTIVDNKIKELFSKISIDSNKGKPIYVINTLLNPRMSILHVEVYFESKDFSIIDSFGNLVEHQIISIEEVDLNDYFIESHFIGKNASQKAYKIHFIFTADVKGYGFTTYYLKDMDKNKTDTRSMINGNILENQYLSVEINNDGSLNIKDKQTNTVYMNQHIIEESGNAGDEYDYSPPKQDEYIYSKGKNAEIEIIVDGPIMAKVKIIHSMAFPKDTYSNCRSKEVVNSRIISYITMYKSIKRIDIKTVIDNQVSNHRIRVLFDTHMRTNEHYVDQQFGIFKRSNFLKQEECWENENWQEKYYPMYNQQKFISLFNGDYGMQIMNKGLPQYEIVGENRDTIALTLLCTTDYMGKQDLVNRPGRRSGLHIKTPNSNMIGSFEAEYSIAPIKDFSEMHLLAEDYAYPLYYYMSNNEQRDYDIIENYYPLAVKNPHIGTSAIKGSEDGEGLIVRLYNTQNKVIKDIELHYDSTLFYDVKTVNFKEQQMDMQNDLIVEDSVVRIGKLKSNEIMTLKLLFR